LSTSAWAGMEGLRSCAFSDVPHKKRAKYRVRIGEDPKDNTIPTAQV
jgi:hypothetical protein